MVAPAMVAPASGSNRRGRYRLIAQSALAVGSLALLSSLASAVLTPGAAAQPTPLCSDDIVAWASACHTSAAPVRAASCPIGHATFVVGPGAIEVDVTRDADGAFVTAGELGASPVGDYPDWALVPAADRAAFDDLIVCLRAEPGALIAALDPSPAPPHLDTAGPHRARVPSLPWRVALGLALALALSLRHFGPRAVLQESAAPLGLALLTFVGRRLLVPDGFFHQNGHGPTWIGYALGENGPYGPGYEHVFGWVARTFSDPDGAVFLTQSVFCALIPAATYTIALGVGSAREYAWALGLAVALSPILARIAGSESYFATQGALLVCAAAILTTTVREGRPVWERVLGAAAVGLLVAEAALIHPVAWLAGALVPGVLTVVRAPRGVPLRHAAIASAVIAVIVAVVAGAGTLDVLSGPLGEAWLEPATRSDGRAVPGWAVLALVLFVLALVVSARKPALRRESFAAALFSATLLVAWRGNLLGAAPLLVHDAYAALYIGPLVAAVAALLLRHAPEAGAVSPSPRVRAAVALALLALVFAWHAATGARALLRATDVREAALMRAWRTHLPDGAVVVHLERAGRQIVALPLHALRTVPLRAEDPRPDLTALGADTFVYRSGICTTERGRAYCDALEAAYVLEPFATATLPAISSMEGLEYDRSEVEVGLYRVRARASGSSTDPTSSTRRDGR